MGKMNLTTKELSLLEDQLSAEQVLVKKYRTVAGHCTDAQLQNACGQIADKHQQHFNTLMGYLQ
jgi:hypothetical protein